MRSYHFCLQRDYRSTDKVERADCALKLNLICLQYSPKAVEGRLQVCPELMHEYCCGVTEKRLSIA